MATQARTWSLDASLAASSPHAVERARDVAVLDLAAVVDRLAVLQRAEDAGAVEVLEAEPDGIHQVVAGGARRIDRVLGEALARGQRRAQLGRLDHEIRGRRRQLHAQQLLAHELAAMDRRGLVGLGEQAEQPALRQHARAVRAVERRLHERAAA